MSKRWIEKGIGRASNASLSLAALAAVIAVAGCGKQADTTSAKAPAPAPVAAAATAPTVEQLEAAVAENPLKDAYFGETHVHTSYSLDAYIGGARITPDEAYRFAKGQDVTVNGQKHNIGRPLDFVAVSDHAEFIGEMYSTQVPGAKGGDNPMLGELRNLKSVDEQRAWFMKYVVSNNRGDKPDHPPFYAGPETTRSAWQDVILKAARDHYQPGRFTTLAGYEWTAAPKAGNMHRNVLFRDLQRARRAVLGARQRRRGEALGVDGRAGEEGPKLLAIPHNSNGSKGLMFEPVDNAGKPLTAEYARLRSHFERLIEMMQIKGNSEVHRKFWPADEFADFENADSVGSFSDRAFKKEYFVRSAVIKGLDYQSKLGANPYQLGFTGGTDNHNGLPSDVAENDYIGSHGPADGTLQARRDGEIDGWIKSQESNPGSDRRRVGGEEHARRDLGCHERPRVLRDVRPAHQAAHLLRRRASAQAGRRANPGRTGVQERHPDGWRPVRKRRGADLHRVRQQGSTGREPRPDPDRQGLGRREGRAARQGLRRRLERERKPGANGKLPAVGNTVDLKRATYTNASVHPN